MMKTTVALLALATVLAFAVPPPAHAGGSEDAALALGSFAVLNQLLRGETVLHDLFGRRREIVRERVIVHQPPPHVVYAPPPTVIYAPPPVVYGPPAYYHHYVVPPGYGKHRHFGGHPKAGHYRHFGGHPNGGHHKKFKQKYKYEYDNGKYKYEYERD